MKTPIFSLALAVLVLSNSVAAEDKPCTIHAKGKFYDLNPLKSSEDHQVSGQDPKALFAINVCQAVHTETWGIKDDIPASDVAAFVRRGHGDFVLGKVNTELSFYDNHPRLFLSSGSKCRSTGNVTQDIRGSAVVDFICDPVTNLGQPRLVAQLPPGNDEQGCAYVIEWRTQYACAVSESGIIWTFFVTLAVIFLVLLLTYAVLGTLYNRFVLQLRGVDQIPQFSFESMRYHGAEAWDWAKDIFSSCASRSGASGGFYSVPSTPNPVSHQTGVGINIRHSEDLEGRAGTANHGKGFVRPLPRAASNSATFARAPQRPVETNPVSHQTQVNAEFEHQRIQSLSQRSPSPSLSANVSSASSPSPRAPLVSVSQSPSPTVPENQPPVPTANLLGSQPAPAPPVTPKTDFMLGDTEEDEGDEQDYNEYNVTEDGDQGAKEMSDFKRPGGASGSAHAS